MSMAHAVGGSPAATPEDQAILSTQGTTFGPVPSRRFGRSLGVNNIPPKICTYSCVYCQVGRTVEMRAEPRIFYAARSIAAEVRRHVEAAERAKERIDHVTIVSDGEPTLDVSLGGLIGFLRPLGIPIAVITNGSLLFRPDVRAAIGRADRVSVKVDAVRDDVWRKVNRPHRRLDLEAVLEGVQAFAKEFKGKLTTETMLVAGVNDDEDQLRSTAAFLSSIRPAAAYLAVPTRPPAEPWVLPPEPGAVARAHEVFHAFLPHVELLLGYEGDEFASTGDALADLLSITAVHPMREAAVHRLMSRRHAPWSSVDTLIEEGKLAAVRYGPHRYYVRTVSRRPEASAPPESSPSSGSPGASGT